nr:RNA-directed DNA polymerase, eukaryota, reverse transcriptase zinc-binding domain protein [Tanacetum cinerariifolium]
MSDVKLIEKRIDDGIATPSDRDTRIKYLENHVSLDEIKSAIWGCGSNKAPDPDGFTFAFVKKYWDLVKMDILEFVNSFFDSCLMPQGANSSFFTLILKARIVGSSIFLHSKNIISLNYVCFKVGCDTRIRFWKDIWIGDSLFNIRYNRLYRLELDKNCLIIDQIENGQWSWNWSRNDLGVRNTAYFRDLLIEISQVDISTVRDTCIWSLAKDDIFSVKEARRGIDDKILPCLTTSTS